MKISKQKFITLFIFMSFILIECITYKVWAKNNPYEEVQIYITESAVLSKEEQETLDLINEYRMQNGLSELKSFAKLQEVAKLKAEDIVNNGYFAHNSENLGTPFEMIENNGIKYKFAGENLAGNKNPERAVEAWIDSKLHRENILEENFQYTGICVIESPVYGKVFVQIFMGI